MTTSTLVDRVRVLSNTVGTASTIALGSAIAGYLGTEVLTDGATYSYLIEQGADFEYGRGVYTAASSTFTRNVIRSTVANTPIAIGSGTFLSFVLLVEDLNERVGIPANLTASGTTGAPGSSVIVGISGTSPNFALAFVIPRGDVGPQGPIGDVTPAATAAAATATTQAGISTTQAGNAAASAVAAGGYLNSVQIAFAGVGYITKSVMAKTSQTQRDYTGSSDFVPLIGGGTYGTFLGVQKSTGDPYGSAVDRIFNKIAGDRGASLASLGVVNLPALAASNGWNGAISYGQSNSGGTDSTPVLTTTTAYTGMITFGSGPKSSKAGNSQGALNTSPGTSTTIALVEDTNQSDGFTPSGETICSSSARRFLEQVAVNNGVDPNSITVLASSAGHGSARISSLNKGGAVISPGTVAWYNQLLDHVSEGKARATAASKSYVVQAVDWIQGEADTQGGNTGTGAYATYLALLLQLQVDIDTDIRALTGQTQSVHLLISPNPYRVLDNAEVVLAQMQACRQSAYIHMAGPRYHLPSASGAVHLSNVGKIRHGADFGRARYQLIYGQRKPDAIDFTSAIATGTALVINCKVPQPPLVIDQVFLPAGTQDYGIKVVDDTGTLTLSNITVKQRQIFITLNRTLGANPKFRYALDYLPSSPNWTNGPAGNIRDSAPDTFTYLGTTYAHPYVAPPGQILISKLAG